MGKQLVVVNVLPQEKAGEVATVRRSVGFLTVRGTGPVGSGLRAAGLAILVNAHTGASTFRAKEDFERSQEHGQGRGRVGAGNPVTVRP